MHEPDIRTAKPRKIINVFILIHTNTKTARKQVNRNRIFTFKANCVILNIAIYFYFFHGTFLEGEILSFSYLI